MTSEQTRELKVEDIKAAAGGKVCPVQQALYYVTEFLAGPMCGRCFPCALGSYEARVRLENLAGGRGTEADLKALKRIAEDMAESSFCKKGKDTAKFMLDWMAAGVFREHVEGNCPDMKCPDLIEYRVIPGKCNACGDCKDACTFGAIHGEKRKPLRGGYFAFEIRQKRCTRCGECLPVCPTGAIILTGARVKEPAGAAR